MYRFLPVSGLAAVWAGSIIMTAPQVAGADSEPPITELPPLLVTDSAVPLPREEIVAPINVLSEEDLVERRAATLGETLEGLPGVHESAFSAGASRPVIRGFSGERVGVFESGLASMDVSDSSPDHGVTIEPFFAESVNVLRGPATLLYGSSAVGGAVNVIDRRIPRQLENRPFAFDSEVRYDSASDGYSAAGLATVEFGDFSVRVSGLKRDHDDYDIPGFAESAAARELHHAEEEGEHDHAEEDHEHEEDHDHEAEEEEHDHEEEHTDGEHEEAVVDVLDNSAVETETGSIALSWFPTEKTRLSAAFFAYDTFYGVPGHVHGEEEAHEDHDHEDEDHDHEAQEDHDEHEEEHDHEAEEEHEAHEHGDVAIDMQQRRFDLDLEHAFDGDFIQSVRLRFAASDYQHVELEGQTVGTRFDRESWEGRAEVNHTLGDSWQGRVGLQAGVTDFDASGAEALAPASETTDLAVVAVEEWRRERLAVNGGVRLEHRAIETVPYSNYDDLAVTLATGARVPLSDNWTLGATLSRSERHPVATELYADGPHAATREYQVGDPTLGKETAYGADLTLGFRQERFSAEVTAFLTSFDDYIALSPQGRTEDGFPVYAYEAVEARFYGFEGSADWVALEDGNQRVMFSAMSDLTRATNRDTGENLPRIPSLRIGGGVTYEWANWTLGTRVRYAFEQDRTAPNELPTDSYFDVRLFTSYVVFDEATRLEVFAAVNNLLDEEIRYHTSALKDLAPEPGRSLSLGARWSW